VALLQITGQKHTSRCGQGVAVIWVFAATQREYDSGNQGMLPIRSDSYHAQHKKQRVATGRHPARVTQEASVFTTHCVRHKLLADPTTADSTPYLVIVELARCCSLTCSDACWQAQAHHHKRVCRLHTLTTTLKPQPHKHSTPRQQYACLASDDMLSAHARQSSSFKFIIYAA
jgi:hypothetical protein